MNQKPNGRACTVRTHHLLLPKIHFAALCRKALVDSVWGLPRT
jgi:hypothetical protein